MDKEVQHGYEYPDDTDIYRTVVKTTETPFPDGTNKEVTTITATRDRMIDHTIPKGRTGRVTYTNWKVIDKQVKRS